MGHYASEMMPDTLVRDWVPDDDEHVESVRQGDAVSLEQYKYILAKMRQAQAKNEKYESFFKMLKRLMPIY